MSKYTIAWLPGDGIGNDVMDATRIVLDKIKLDAEYVHGDIGWEFWCKEGDAFPQRTIDLLNSVNAAMFGAITSKPVKAAEAELIPDLRGKGLMYRSPIVRMRQMFDLYICLRPCKAYPGNPLNFKEGIDLVVFRENTEDLYCGRGIQSRSQELADVLSRSSRNRFILSKDLPVISTPSPARSIPKRGRSGLSAQRSSSHGSSSERRSPSSTRRMSFGQRTDCSLRAQKKWRSHFPEIQFDEANVDAICMWLLKNPFNYDVLVAPNLYGDIISDLCAQMVGGLGFGCSG